MLKLQKLANNLAEDIKAGNFLAIVVKSGIFECVGVSIHEINQRHWQDFNVIVKDSFVLKNRVANKYVDVPHARTDNWLIIKQLR